MIWWVGLVALEGRLKTLAERELEKDLS